MPIKQTCVRCKRVKPVTEFNKSKRHKHGLDKTCKACYRVKYDKYKSSGRSGVVRRARYEIPNARLSHMVAQARQRAKIKNLEFDLDAKWQATVREQRACSVTRIPFDYGPDAVNFRNPRAPSLDRIDATRGYTKDNCRLVVWFVNVAKGQMPDEQFNAFMVVAAENMFGVTIH